MLRVSSPVTAAGPLPILTGFPFKPFRAPWKSFLHFSYNRKKALVKHDRFRPAGFFLLDFGPCLHYGYRDFLSGAFSYSLIGNPVEFGDGPAAVTGDGLPRKTPLPGDRIGREGTAGRKIRKSEDLPGRNRGLLSWPQGRAFPQCRGMNCPFKSAGLPFTLYIGQTGRAAAGGFHGCLHLSGVFLLLSLPSGGCPPEQPLLSDGFK